MDSAPRPARIRVRVHIGGVVQGVGFRPFVAALADRLALSGYVGNDGSGVILEAEGTPESVAGLLEAVAERPPPLASVEQVRTEPLAATGEPGFRIVSSDLTGPREALVAADSATCPDCLREMGDPGDRRFGYAFTNCTNCGPRFSIVLGVPYDRAATTMADFAMCAACAREFADPADRRYHAQPVCCPACGPRLALLGADGSPVAGEPVAAAADLVRSGAVLAVKGLGGYHLAVDASCEEAVAALRARKHRAERPFAVMVADESRASELCELDAAGRRLLSGTARPIVLLARRPGAPIAGSVAPGQRRLGLVLPYTPLHHLLLDRVGRPIVLTSGNRSEEPIAYRDREAIERLRGIADAFLTHDRRIQTRVDDSVVQIAAGRPAMLRRSRGYAPLPVPLAWDCPRPVLACGPELKSTVCLARDRHAFVSQHLGDLENFETFSAFTEAITHLGSLFSVAPEVVAYDLHPDYLSTKYALDLEGVALVGVQHHHAHIASCLADNADPGPVIGVAFDGLGMGQDGTLWGGEFLLADLAGYRRLAQLAPVAMPGGAAAIHEPWRMAAAYLDAAYDGQIPGGLAPMRGREQRFRSVLAAARAGVNAPLTSSAGRLFDAVAAVAGLRSEVSYEGQAAIELEQVADPRELGGYPCGWDGVRARGSDLVRACAEEMRAATAVPLIAARFHNGLAALVLSGCERIRDAEGVTAVALSGGVFQNVLLLERCRASLVAAGFRVLTHARVPCNDGGISLGQAVVAAAQDRLPPGQAASSSWTLSQSTE